MVRYLAGFGCGVNEISRITGLAQTTVSNWVCGRGAPLAEARATTCWRCGDTPGQAPPKYVYLLGLYLGDGHIVATSRKKDVFRLEISQDATYEALIAECRDVMATMPPNSVSLRSRPGCTAIGSYSKHWPCLFPQHGPGKKHLRPISLAAWQQELVDQDPKSLVRGLIHSDGCRAINRVVTRGKPYEYPRYQFTNESDDIRRIFTDTCELLDVHWTQTNHRTIAVSRRADVEFLDTFIGPKS